MKVDELALFLQTNNVDITYITETWLKSTVPSSATNIARYSVVRNDRHDEIIGGGVCVYIRNTIRYKLRTELRDNYVVHNQTKTPTTRCIYDHTWCNLHASCI